jgi:nucleoid-associated protein YgaU
MAELRRPGAAESRGEAEPPVVIPSADAAGPPGPPPAQRATEGAVAADSGAEEPSGRSPDALLAEICPYLLARDGGWRAARPVRDHRCTAVEPPALVAPATQAELCLTATHTACGAYRSAVERREGELADAHIAPGVLASARFRTLARAAPVAIDAPAPGIAARAARMPPRATTLLALVLALTAVALLFVFRPADEVPPGHGVGAPGPTATVPRGTDRPATAAPSAEAPRPTTSTPPTARPSPAIATGTYRVRRGDTLKRIAERLGTTPAVIRRLNDLPRPATLEVGQVLIVPLPTE